MLLKVEGLEASKFEIFFTGSSSPLELFTVGIPGYSGVEMSLSNSFWFMPAEALSVLPDKDYL